MLASSPVEAFPSRSVVQQEIAARTLVAVLLPGMDVRIEYLFVHRKDKHLPAAAKSFQALLQHEQGKT